MNKKIVTFGIYLFLFIFIAFIVIFAINLDVKDNRDYYFDTYSVKVKNELYGLLNRQKQVDLKLSEIYESSEFTIDDPYIEVNPYEIAPLSAIAIFKTNTEEEVKVYLNDVYLTKTEKSVRHAVPICGLYNSGLNILKLSSKGKEKEFEIKVKSYNNEIGNFDLANVTNKNGTTLLLGDINKNSSNIRGFDQNNNLNYYLDLSYIGAFKVGDYLNVGYNQKKGLKLLNLKMDYLGKISEIQSDTSNLLDKSNISLEGDYIFNPVKYYKKTTKNYEFINYKYLEDITENEVIYTNDYKKELTNAEVYKDDVMMSFNGDYLSWNNLPFKKLILVGAKNANSRIYNIENLNMIKVSIDDEDMALYAIDEEGNYYRLNRELKLS